MLATQCSHCSTHYRVPEAQAGKSVRCKKCNQTFTIPMNLSLGDDEDVPVLEVAAVPPPMPIPLPPPPPPSPRKAPDEPLPLPLPTSRSSRAYNDERDSRYQDDDPDPAPRGKRSRSRSSYEGEPAPSTPSLNLALLGLGGVTIMGILVGIVGLAMSSSSASPRPTAAIPPPNPAPVPFPGPNPGPGPNPIPGPGPGLNPNPIPIPNPIPPIPQPKKIDTVPEALKQLKTKDRFKAMDAVAFLKVAKPESKHFKEVNETVVPLLRDPRWGDSAAQLLTHWANPDLLPLLEPLLEKPNFFVTNRLMPILEKLATEEAAVPVLAKLLKERSLTSRTVNLLKKAGKKAEPHLLPLINTTDGGLKNEIEMALTAMGTEEKTLRAQSVKDLSSEDQFIRRNAAERLKKYKPDPTMEEEFRAAGTGLLKMSKEPLNGPLALDVMKTGWVSKDLLPELLERLEKGGFEATRIVEILAILKEPSSFEPIAVYLSKHPFAERQVREAFIAIGSPAEEAVMKLVGNTNVVVNRSALQILGEIGTTKSLNALTKASATLTRIDLGSRMVLNATITKIKERMKK